MRILNAIFVVTALLQGVCVAQTNSTGNSAPVEVDKRNYNVNVMNNQNELSLPSQDVRSSGYYKQEASEYGALLQQAPSSAQAWLNLYKSSLYASYNGTSKVISATRKEELNDIVDQMKAKIPGTFEYNLAVYLNGQHNTSLIGYLAKAEELNANQLDVIEQYVAYHSIMQNQSKLKEYVGKHRKLVKYEAFIDEYAYNLLMSVESDAILFTHGILDTYPLYHQQLNEKANSGVTIINIDYLSSDTYVSNLEQKLGIKISRVENNYTAAFDIAEKLSSTRNVYFSNTFSKNDLKKHLSKLEVSGLAMHYVTNSSEVLKNDIIWKTKFKKTQIEKVGMKDDYAKKMANNYLPMIVSLHKLYKDKGEQKEAGKMKELALKIGAVNGNKEQLLQLLNN